MSNNNRWSLSTGILQRQYLVYASLILLAGSLLILGILLNARAKASPQLVNVSTISPNSFTVSYFTERPGTTKLVVSDNKEFTNSLKIYDVRDYSVSPANAIKPVNRTSHMHIANNLEPNTKYYFKIQSFIKETYVEGLYTLKTPGVTQKVETPIPVYGEVLDVNNNPREDIIIELQAVGKDETTSSTISSFTSNSGTYSLDLANLRTNDLQDVWNINNSQRYIVRAKDLDETYFYEVEELSDLAPVKTFQFASSNEVSVKQSSELQTRIIQPAKANSCPENQVFNGQKCVEQCKGKGEEGINNCHCGGNICSATKNPVCNPGNLFECVEVDELDLPADDGGPPSGEACYDQQSVQHSSGIYFACFSSIAKACPGQNLPEGMKKLWEEEPVCVDREREREANAATGDPNRRCSEFTFKQEQGCGIIVNDSATPEDGSFIAGGVCRKGVCQIPQEQVLTINSGKTTEQTKQEDIGSGPVQTLPQTAPTLDKNRVAKNRITKKVMMVTYNPDNIRTARGWADPNEIAEKYIADIKEVSSGILEYQIVDRKEINEFPHKKLAESQMNSSILSECLEGKADSSTEAICKAIIDYQTVIKSINFCDMVNNNQADELWLFGGPWFGFYESNMIGSNAYFLNSPPTTDTSCKRNAVVMGFNYERPEQMLHDAGHMMENVITKVYYKNQNNIAYLKPQQYSTLKDTSAKLFMKSRQNSDDTVYGCGTIHYTPQGKKSNGDLYEYKTDQNVPSKSYCDAFFNYPQLHTADGNLPSYDVNSTNWGGNQLDYIKYWLSRIPKYEGTGTDGIANNWWLYFADPALALTVSPETINVPTEDNGSPAPTTTNGEKNKEEIESGDELQPGKYVLANGVTLSIDKPLTITLYEDSNGNGMRDPSEKILENSSIEVLEKKDLFTYTLVKGWNAINLPFLKSGDSGYTASEIAAIAKGQNIAITSLKKWEGRWVEYGSDAQKTYGQDFRMRPNQGYFMQSNQSGTLKINGVKPTNTLPLQFLNGWSFIGIAPGEAKTGESNFTNTGLSKQPKAFEFIDTVHKADNSVDISNVTRYDKGAYRGVNVGGKDRKKFGLDFSLIATEAYFVKTGKKAVFAP